MIDYTAIQFPCTHDIIDFGVNHVVTFLGREFKADYSTHTNSVIRYVGYLKNLRVELYNDRIVAIGSISRFLNNSNAVDLSLKELEFAFESLCSLFNCNMDVALIKSFEFGFTIPVTIAPNEIIERLVIHKSAVITDWQQDLKLIGRTFSHHNYKFKVYNKSAEQLNNGGLHLDGMFIRIEQKFSYKHFKTRIQTVKDLVTKDNLIASFSEFSNQWNAIIKEPFIDTSNMTAAKREWYYARLNPLYWKDEKSRNDNNAKMGKARFKDFLNKTGDFNTYNQIEKTFTTKFNNLISDFNTMQFQPTIIGGKRVQENIEDVILMRGGVEIGLYE